MVIFSWTKTSTIKAHITRETNNLPRWERKQAHAIERAEKYGFAEDWKTVGRFDACIDICKRRIADAQAELAARSA